jgi:DNA transposition AAA+ family ATPase
MKEERKQEIRDALERFCMRYGSQKKATAALKDISEGTISTILNGRFDKIGDDMWSRLEAQVMPATADYSLADTSARLNLLGYFRKMKEDSSMMWITGPAGVGKSTAAREFVSKGQNAFMLTCATDMVRSDFMQGLSAAVGLDNTGLNVRETLYAIIRHLVTLERPLLIFDEADKLRDDVLMYFITIYNELEDRCGIVFLSTDSIKRRMEIGVSYNKLGYNELYSRICRRFVPVKPATRQEVIAICRANGIEDRKAIHDVLAEADDAQYDLRRVKRSIVKQKGLKSLSNQ